MGVKTEFAATTSPAEDKIRVVRPPRARKRAKRPKNPNEKPIVTEALSKLTKDMVHIPIRDIGTWVNRPTEERIDEVARNNGKIARPMNSFMLYRSAYAERTKEWCAKTNHQVVSKAAGQGWKLETPEIKALYNHYAEEERKNHHNAHPEYKFAPRKDQHTPKRRRADEDEEASDLDDDGLDITSCPRQLTNKRMRGSSNGYGNRSRTGTPDEHDSSYDSRHSTPLNNHNAGDIYLSPDANRSSWEMINPGRPLPGILSPPEQTHYYQPSIHQSTLGPNIEDVTYKKLGIPGGMHYDAAATLTGLPGNTHPDLLQPHPHPHPPSRTTPVSMDDVQVDPQLLEFEPREGAAGYANMWQFPPPSDNQHYMHSNVPPHERENYHHSHHSHHSQQGLPPAMPPQIDSRDMWSESAMAPPAGQEFEEWFSGTVY